MILFQLKGKTKIWGVSVIWNRLTLKKNFNVTVLKDRFVYTKHEDIFKERRGKKKSLKNFFSFSPQITKLKHVYLQHTRRCLHRIFKL